MIENKKQLLYSSFDEMELLADNILFKASSLLDTSLFCL